MYIIRMDDDTLGDKCWVRHSNSSSCSGYFLGEKNKARLFTKEIDEIPKLKSWLAEKEYSYTIVEVPERKGRIYYRDICDQ